MNERRLAGRTVLLAAVTATGVVIGLWVVPWTAGGSAVGVDPPDAGSFPSWLWPTMVIAVLTLIWLFAAFTLVIKPARHAYRYGSISRHDAGSAATSTDSEVAEGWYKDPYGVHQYRWFSVGKASSLVRDGHLESNDPPPGGEYEGRLVSEGGVSNLLAHGADLRRVGDGRKDDYWDVAVDASTWFPIN